MQIAFGERPMPKAIIDFVRIGIMIARNPPHLGEPHGVFQSQIEIFARLEIAQNDNGIRAMLAHGLVDMLKLSVRIAAEKNIGQRTVPAPASTPSGISDGAGLLFLLLAFERHVDP